MSVDKYVVSILGNWRDDLCWCPSQCYLKISYLNKNYEIYLRWRWEDPWSATLCDDDGLYHQLNIEFFTDKQIEEVKKASIKEAKRILYSSEHLLSKTINKPKLVETYAQKKHKERENKLKKLFY